MKKNCLECKYLNFSNTKILQDCFYSDMSLYCELNKWSFNCRSNSKKDLKKMLEMANTCKEIIKE